MQTYFKSGHIQKKLEQKLPGFIISLKNARYFIKIQVKIFGLMFVTK